MNWLIDRITITHDIQAIEIRTIREDFSIDNVQLDHNKLLLHLPFLSRNLKVCELTMFQICFK